MEAKPVIFSFPNGTLVYNEGTSEANNLFFLSPAGEKLWQMTEVAPANDCATLVKKEGDDAFYFATFFGLSFTIDAATLKAKEKGFVK